MQYRFLADRNRSLYSALLLRVLLCREYGTEWNTLQFEKSRYGKPHLLFPSGMHFNLSHTDGALLCAAGNAPVGADTEAFRQPFADVMKHCFHPEEIRYIRSAPEPEQAVRFYEIWTRKEAFLKCSGTGLTNQLSAVCTLNPELQPHYHIWKTEHASYACYAAQTTPVTVKQLRKDELTELVCCFCKPEP